VLSQRLGRWLLQQQLKVLPRRIIYHMLPRGKLRVLPQQRRTREVLCKRLPGVLPSWLGRCVLPRLPAMLPWGFDGGVLFQRRGMLSRRLGQCLLPRGNLSMLPEGFGERLLPAWPGVLPQRVTPGLLPQWHDLLRRRLGCRLLPQWDDLLRYRLLLTEGRCDVSGVAVSCSRLGAT
jgi:hypothetical protein